MSMMGTAKLYSILLCVHQISVNMTQGFQVKIFNLPDAAIGMACDNYWDCQAVLSNTVSTSNQCEYDTGFSGQDFQSSRCCHCVNDANCQVVLSNTVCTSNQSECGTGFSGPDFLSFSCCLRDGMCQ